MRVVKLGGSLLSGHDLLACLNKLATLSGQTVIVPGGGVFADQVRLMQQRYDFADVYAHRMALLAMQQMAQLYKGLKPEFHWLADVEAHADWQGRAIWLPDVAELDQAGVAASWDISSDSLAVWLAAKLSADACILVKSGSVNPQGSLSELQNQGIVDAAFCQYAAKLNCPITIINKADFIRAL